MFIFGNLVLQNDVDIETNGFHIKDQIMDNDIYNDFMINDVSSTQNPKNNSIMMQMLGNREIFVSISFNPNEASSQIAQGILRNSTKTFTFQNGSIANTHFLAIPKFSKNIEQSLNVINELISPKYQGLKVNNEIWGDPTVLDISKLTMKDQSLFEENNSINNLKKDYPTIIEPHQSWTEAIEKNWIESFN